MSGFLDVLTGLGPFVAARWEQFAYSTFQHFNLVVQAVALASVAAVLIAVVVTALPRLEPVATMVSAIGLTLPSFALVGLLLPAPFGGLGNTTAFLCVFFYAVLPVLRNAVVGLQGVDPTLVESARGMGMTEAMVLLRVKLPLAWPVILAGIRTSMQMSMGIAAIAAVALGPGLGAYIFTGVNQAGSANGVNYALVGTLGILLVATVADLLLLLLGRATISKGTRA